MTPETATTTGSLVLLTRLARTVYRRAAHDQLGMSLKEFGTLNLLHDMGGTSSQAALREVLCVDANTMVLLLNELETHGYVSRERDPADRRRHLVALTAEGRKALKAGERVMDTFEDDILAGLDPAERSELAALLDKALGAQR